MADGGPPPPVLLNRNITVSVLSCLWLWNDLLDGRGFREFPSRW